MHRRGAAYCLALITLCAACGKGPDVASDRVVASPVPSASVDPLKTKDPKTPGPRSPDTRTAAPPGTVTRATAAPADPEDLADARVKLTKIATLDDDPVAVAVRKGDSAFYIAERHSGHIHRVRGSSIGAPILDIGNEISTGYEQGLLGLAFSPDGDEMYINFTTATSQTPPNVADTVVREYNFDGRPTSPREVLRIPQPATNHNGGNLMFGRDGYLYIGMGDGGGAPENRSQDLAVLLGKMLRIDPLSADESDCGDGAYGIPSSNPFVGKSGCDEIWARGLRNPWRYSFDRITGALWIGDVGAGGPEEIDVASGNSDGGENYGWPAMEGTRGTPPADHHGPIYEYSHGDGSCSVTGGYVYRGSRIPALRGAYVFVDHCVGRLRAFVNVGGRAAGHRFLGPRAERLSSFGQDANGELYAVTLTGDFYRLDPA